MDPGVTPMMQQLITAVSGPLGALALSVAILVWLAKVIVPVLKGYLDTQNERLGNLVTAIEKTVASHTEDRKVFEAAIHSLTTRVDKIEDDVRHIRSKLP
jgi:hypothetical protein